METQEEKLPGRPRERFPALLQQADYPGLDEAWMEEIASAGEGGLGDPEPFLAVADALLERSQKERVVTLLELLYPLYERAPSDQRQAVLRRMVLASPRRPELRAALVDLFRGVHGQSPLVEVGLTISSLETAPDPAKALALFDRLIRFQPGTSVFHASGWGVGVVESIDTVLRTAVVDLEKKRHHRIDLKVIGDILEPLAPEHFLALGREGPGKLRELADSDPVKLVGVVISSFGNPLDLKAIKARLVPEVIPSESWSRWWNRAKGLLRDSGFYRVSDRSPFSVERLKQSVSYEDELQRQFEAGDSAARLAIARKYGRDRSGGFARLRERVISELRSLLSREKGARAVETAAVLEKIAAGEPGVEGALLKALQQAPDPVEAILAVEGAEERKRSAQVLREAAGDSWPELLLSLLLRGDDALRDEATRMLSGTPAQPRALAVVAEALRLPRNSPDLFAWACRSHLSGNSSPVLEPLRNCPPLELVGRILDALDNLGMRGERDGKSGVRDTIGRVRGLLASDEGRFFREVIGPLPREDARGIYQRVLACGGLSEPLRAKLLEILMSSFPDITRPQARPIWEEDAIYVTTAGLAKKQAEFRDLTEEKLPKNFQDIGRAAAFGDLSENAEYTAALEERDRLTKRATEIKAQLDRVHLIDPSMLKEGEITLGARVRLVNSQSGHQVSYRILGPWDGGPEDGVLNYGSPLAIVLLGKKVGDEVEAQLPGGTERFKVIEVGSSFE